jgi:hypothetical protein
MVALMTSIFDEQNRDFYLQHMKDTIPTDVAILWAILEVARQLMIANELAIPNAKMER